MQLEIPWQTEESFKDDLRSRAGVPFDIVLTDNTSSILTFEPGGSERGARLRIHRMFLHAGPDILHALTIWLTRRRTRRHASMIDAFIRDHQHLVQEAPRRSVRLRTVGIHHSLKPHYNEVNLEFFKNSVDAAITWGRMPTSRQRRKSIRFGSYTPSDHLIRVHPLLDQAFVPDFFVRYIVYHEMLHAFLGVETGPSRRRCIHPPEFRREEQNYPDYARAVAWHDNPRNLSRLLRGIPEQAKSA
ncbi:MAG: hypothetical protein IID08_01275 [Candidatus Hydrogenedentes bacterium]|nr:hypothetical protein [Candidatus Hydrogenedentota bacterium]